ncbi:hypothetical protein QAD02_010078 [Eretmocerus hayati]|uniref:Uncharacterized protein n=1 Tax=Eretmocerus hayati TaxID=131215 RepID=A0ACC2NFQ9_9HYME|nr:hypothetical protein QAD02_010078 [Eretmocerus hayati]
MLQSAEKCVDEASDDTMKLYRENARLSKEISKAEITCDNSIEIAYSEKYGNHLIAARDIKPGEILVVEKTFSTLHPEKSYAYCAHCTSFLWEMVPCETCSNICFCSEKCKSEAWEQYHDVECTISVFLLLFHKGAKTLHPQVGLKMFITAIRQAGSIQVLRNSLESLEECKRKFIDFSENGKYIDYRHVYALSSKNFNELEENFVCYWSTINLFILAKFPSPVRKFFTFQNFNPAKLMKNSDFLFLGSLLLRFCAISATHCTQAFKVEHDMRHPIDTQRCLMTGCCTVSIAFGVRSSLVPPSCVPNAGRTVIENNKIILYAIQPIKKGAQILRSGGLSIFQDTPKYMRQEAIRELTGSDCDCQACAENWPVLDLLANPYEGFPYLSPEESDVRREIESTLMQFGDLDTLSAKKISKFSKIVEDMVGRSPLPSKLTALAINCLYGLIDVSHGFQNKPRVPHECIT